MLSFYSGVTVALFLFRFRLLLFSLNEAAALHLIVLRSSICMRPGAHTQLSVNNRLRPLMLGLSCFLGGVVFPVLFCIIIIAFSSFYGV